MSEIKLLSQCGTEGKSICSSDKIARVPISSSVAKNPRVLRIYNATDIKSLGGTMSLYV